MAALESEFTFLGLSTGGGFARSEWIADDKLRLLLTALMPANRLALEVSRVTGLRIGDVLALKTETLRKGQRFTVKEQKTGKAKRVYIPLKLWESLLSQAGRYYVFESRLDQNRPRTRQAVSKDLARVARLYRIDGKQIAAHITPHSARKAWAVEELHNSGNLEAVRKKLNHSDSSVTLLYAMADVLTERAHRGGAKKKRTRA